MKAAIGLDFPIFDNSIKAEAAACGARDLSFGRINSNAATVSSYLAVLLLKSALSLARSASTVSNLSDSKAI